jgi:hypothetical protein
VLGFAEIKRKPVQLRHGRATVWATLQVRGRARVRPLLRGLPTTGR